ncbi:MAG: AraC family transcriptional regulator [Mycobacteriales bacterium]
MAVHPIRFVSVAAGRDYHAALVRASSPRWSTPIHTHADFLEFFLVTAGTGNHLINDTTQTLGAGSLVLVRPADRHHFRASGRADSTDFAFINIAIPAPRWRALADLCALPTASYDDPELPPTAVLTESRRPTVETAFRRALEAYQRRGTTVELLPAWSAAIQALPAGSDEARTRSLAPDWFLDACEAMADESNLRGGLPRFAELSAVSRAHLARLVRRVHGCTPVQYVTRLRLSSARVLLASTNEPVGAISRRCGFASLSYFSRQFSRYTGMSPREYRAAKARDDLGLIWPDAAASAVPAPER